MKHTRSQRSSNTGWALCTSFVGLLLIAGCSVEGKLHVEDCISEFCLDKAKLVESDIVRNFGKGEIKRETDTIGNIIHCYFHPEHNAWLELTFDSQGTSHRLLEVFVSRTPLCNKKFLSKRQLKAITTSRDIGLGATQADVMRAYGKPSRVDDRIAMEQRNPANRNTHFAARFGSPVLVYLSQGDDLLRAEFYLKENRVQSVLISISE